MIVVALIAIAFATLLVALDRAWAAPRWPPRGSSEQLEIGPHLRERRLIDAIDIDIDRR